MSENYGCFTTLRVDRTSPDSTLVTRGWRHHVARLQRDSTALFGAAVSERAMLTAVHAALAAADAAGNALPRLVRLAVERPNLEISFSSRDLTPADFSLRTHLVPYLRERPELKHTRTAGEFALREAALAAGYDDAIMVSPSGELLEGTFWTLVLGRPDGTWVTPAGPVLPSVTLEVVRASRVEIAAHPISVDSLPQFDRAAALSAGRGVQPVVSIGSWTGGGSVEVLVSSYAGAGGDPLTVPA